MVPMRVINSTPRSVMIEGVDGGGSSLGQAQSLAEQECQKHSRHSVFKPDNQRDGIAHYECKE